MKCPYCEHEFKLTWKRYLKAPFGKHTCPNCNKKSKLNYTSKYFAAIVVFFLPFLIAIIFLHSSLVLTSVVKIIFLLLVFPMDRWAESKFKKLVPIE
ncbi:MAG: hypothetical protein KAG61_06335 [Bacteriovoracaceae bacterium]|nr:hypothetical protein [Bacteriovoracaceae bacterium]